MARRRNQNKMNLNNKIELAEDIFLYENFLTPEQCAAVIKVLDKQAEGDKITWMPISFYESYSSVLPQDGDSEIEEFGLPADIFTQIKNGIIDSVAQVAKIDSSKVVQIGYHTQKWEPGAYARPHSDNTEMDGSESPFERSRYASFLYLNDDFEGGLLRFTNQDISVKPKVGLLATFSGSFHNLHEVTMITKGIRYTIGSFWDDREESDYPQEVRDKWAEQMKEIRAGQEIERQEWQNLLKDGYKLDLDGKPYKIEEIKNA